MGEVKRRNRGQHREDKQQPDIPEMMFFEQIVRQEVDKVMHETPAEQQLHPTSH